MAISFPSEEYKGVEDVLEHREIPDRQDALHAGSFFGEPIAKVDTTRSPSVSDASTKSTSLMMSTESFDEDDMSTENEEWDDSVWRDVDDVPSIKVQESAEELLQKSQGLLALMVFHPQEVKMLQRKIQQQQKVVEEMMEDLSKVSSAEKEQIVLIGATLTRLGELRDHFIVKEKMLSQYLESDPFNDKHVLYPRRIYAEAARLVFEKKEQSRMACDYFYRWYDAEVSYYEKADPMQCSHDPEFYLDKKNRSNPLVKYNAQRAARALRFFDKALQGSIDAITKQVEKAAGIAMNQSLAWDQTERHLIFSMGEKTGAYLQVSTPLSKSETAVGEDLRRQGIGGIIPSVRDDGRAPINTRLTQLFKIESGKKILIHERQQHGINDHFAIQDSRQRRQANLSSMRQLIQSGAEADSAFIRDAIEYPDQQHQLFYINTNLTTPTWTPRGSNNNEFTYSRHQGMAMKSVEKEKAFLVLHPDDSTKQESVDLDVTCIDFRFPVNYAISDPHEDLRALDPGMILVWPMLEEHNQGEFRKLFGSVNLYAPIGGLLGSTYKKLCAQARTDANPNSVAIKLQREIEEQVLYLREMFQTGAYQRAEQDRFKMPRHIDLLVNAFRRASELVDNHQVRVVNAGGCMSGKDREGVANAENEAAVIIQDLGRNIEPSKGSRYDAETQVIYDTCMTGVVDNTRQVTGIGGSKNAKEIANQMSDLHAISYAQGASQFVKA
ncbi:MAG: hypothetical protein FJ390_02930 [Verrucomicrobia bacterium]|nr:hypothetical protein [Verrucomicrobiota bacterium]